MGYVLSSLVIDQPSAWRLIFGAAAPLSLLMAAGMASLPPSPRWLLLRLTTGKAGTDTGTGSSMDPGPAESASLREEAVQALMRLRGGTSREEEEQARQEVEEMVKTMEEGERQGGRGSGGKEEEWKEFVTGVNGRALTVACGLVLFQQVSVAWCSFSR